VFMEFRSREPSPEALLSTSAVGSFEMNDRLSLKY